MLKKAKNEAKKKVEWNFATEVSDLKSKLMVSFPFYGAVLFQMQLIESDQIQTAGTNGKVIYYNKNYMKKLSIDERTYVIFHELLHVVLLHWKRREITSPELWNLAADFVVNGMLDELQRDLKRQGVFLLEPRGIVKWKNYNGESAEELYAKILDDPEKYSGRVVSENRDLFVINEMNPIESKAWEEQIKKIVKEEKKRQATSGHSYLISDACLNFVETKRLPWKVLLKRFLKTYEIEERSYQTPERKYLHMDLILPGVEKSVKSELKEVWTFIDVSASIEEDTRDKFITQLFHLASGFHTVLNIVYWHTEISDEYLEVRKKEDLLRCVPRTTGGTDPTCIYTYLRERKIDPDVMLILTDGCFLPVSSFLVNKLKKKTIIVLSEEPIDDLSYMGTVAEIYE